jgi:hypothetical protein
MKANYIYWLLACLFIFSTAQGQINTAKVTKAHLPKAISYKGHMADGQSWSDASGKHYVIPTETGEFIGKDQHSGLTECDGECKDAELYVYHFVQSTDSVALLWQLTDFIKTCPFDVLAQFSKGSLSVTDLDKDGTPEVWFVYKTTLPLERASGGSAVGKWWGKFVN